MLFVLMSATPTRSSESLPGLHTCIPTQTQMTLRATTISSLTGASATRQSSTVDEYGVLFRNLFSMASLEASGIRGIVISSVVPRSIPFSARSASVLQFEAAG